MNPAPPVIIIFLTSGSGSNFVLPFKIGASFQTPKSSKNLLDPLVAAVIRISWSVGNSQDCGGRGERKTYMKTRRWLHFW